MAKTRLTKKLLQKENDTEEDIKDQPEEEKKSKRPRAQKKKSTSTKKEKQEPEEDLNELLKPELAAEEKNEEDQIEEEFLDINGAKVLKEEEKEEEVAGKKNVKKHIVFKKDVNVKKVITLKRMNGGLYAYVEYTEKNKKKQKELQYGFIDTKEFVKSDPQILLEFYESVLEIEP